MKPPVIFLNELSCKFESVARDRIIWHIKNAVDALRRAAETRRDLVLGSSVPLPALLLGEEKHAIGAVMSPCQIELRYLMSLARANPWPAIIDSQTAGLSTEIWYGDMPALGLTWTEKEGTLAISFGYAPHWSNQYVAATLHSIDEKGEMSSKAVEIPNLSSVEQADLWREFLRDFGFHPSVSSIISRGEGYLVRMFLNDHEPAHVHIQPPDGRRTIAKLRIDTLELLEGSLPTEVRRVVMDWAAENRQALLQSWERCRSGLLPLYIDRKTD